jgi:predicted RNA binding protein with dsRBD fold (UPF0201 family)
MDIPHFQCKILAHCKINPSEDPRKVEHAVSNILPRIEIKITNNHLEATSHNIETLSKIYETIHSRKSQNIYRRQIASNLDKQSSWFFLNKQAAFSNTVTICDEPAESPLGPIKVSIISDDIEEVIDWLLEP